MNNLLSFIQRISTGRVVIAFFIPAMTIYLIMIFYTIPQVEKYSPGMKLFDLSPTGYSFEYANELLRALGPTGRELYLYHQLPLDFLYPGLFSVSCCMLLSWLFSKTKKPNSKIFYFCFVPLTAGLFDYLENLFIVRFLLYYPEISDKSVNFASLMTVAKSGLTVFFFVLMITGSVTALTKIFKEKVN